MKRIGILVLAVASAAAVACGGASGTTFRVGIVEPGAIDPYTVGDVEGYFVTRHLFEGLTVIDPSTSTMRSGVATSWEPNEDCTIWTFHLRDDSVFSNGETVTAESFIRGMTRAASSDAASETAYHMAGIAGYDDLHGTEDTPQGTANTFTGLSAPDSRTLVVNLAEPDCEFEKKTSHPVMSPVPADAGGADNKDFNDMPIGNGAFRMKEPWQHDERITLVRNEAYAGPAPYISEIEFTILTGDNAGDQEYRGLEAQRFDLVQVPPQQIRHAHETYGPRNAIIEFVGPATIYLFPVTTKAPLDNADARKAISFALNREAIVGGPLQGAAQPATSLVPPALRSHYQGDACVACIHDVTKAREHAEAGRLRAGTTLEFTYFSDDPSVAVNEAVVEQLQTSLGLDVKVTAIPFAEGIDRMQSPTFTGIGAIGWAADYPTADNFLFPLLSSASIGADNLSRYSNRQFDALLGRARAAKTDAQRVSITREAEKMVIGREQAVIPLFHPKDVYAYDSDRWSGIEIGFEGVPTLTTVRPA